jgi:ketosteroid isomerase-like protein
MEVPVPDSPQVQIVKKIVDALGRGDIDAILEHVHPECVLETPHARDVVPFGGTWHGADAARRAIEARIGAMESRTHEPRFFEETGNAVAVILAGEYFVPKTDRSYRAESVMLFEFDDGKVVRFRLFVDPAHAARGHQP